MRYIIVRADPGDRHRLTSTTYEDRAAFIKAAEAFGFTERPRPEQRGNIRPELIGQPKFDSLYGPMWGGLTRGDAYADDGEPTIRYETGPAYETLSA